MCKVCQARGFQSVLLIRETRVEYLGCNPSIWQWLNPTFVSDLLRR